MKFKLNKLCKAGFLGIWLVMGFITSLAHAGNNYYVSPDGSDSNPGTLESPWQHIAYATCGGSYGCPVSTPNPNKLQAGDTLYIREGTYNEYDIRVTNSGTAGNPITIRNYLSELPVIDAQVEGMNNLKRPIFYLDNTNWVTLDGLTLIRSSLFAIRIGENNPASHITIQNCDINSIRGDTIGSVTAAIRLDTLCSQIIIKNNTLHTDVSFCPQCMGIVIFAGNNDAIIENNEIYNLKQGIFYKHGSNLSGGIRVRYNKIYNFSDIGIHTRANNGLFEHNLIYDGLMGIRVYEEGSCYVNFGYNNTFFHNTIVNIADGIRLLAPTGQCALEGTSTGAQNNKFFDNLIYNFTNSDHRGLSVWSNNNPPTDNSNTTFDHNLIYSDATTTIKSSPIRVINSYYNTSTCPLSICTNNIQQGPIFVDYANNNFTLTPNSPGYHAASDGTDMGADVSLVGINPGGIPDDLNGDSKVSIADIQLCIKVILNQLDPIDDAAIIQRAKELAAPYDAATIKDIQEIIRIILGG